MRARLTPPRLHASSRHKHTAKHGEKRLRSQLARTREWSDLRCRAAAAAAADDDGDDELAAALRGRDLSALRKRGFFALCRAWGYRSDVWRPAHAARVAAAAARREARVAAAAPPPHPPPMQLARAHAPHALAPSAAVLLARELNPLVSRFVSAVWFPSVLDAARAEPRAPLATLNAPATRAVAALAAALRARTLAHAAALRAAARGGGDALCTPAAQLCDASAPPLAEAALQRVLLMAQAMCAALSDAASPTGGVCAALARPLSGPERAHFADAFAAVHAAHVLLARAAAALAAVRAAAPGGAYLAAGAVVCDALAALLGSLAEANEARVAAFSARPLFAAGGSAPHDELGWRSTYFFKRLAADDRWWAGGGGSAAAAGCVGAPQRGGVEVAAVLASVGVHDGGYSGSSYAPQLLAQSHI
jgi:hypothetical protein